MNMFVEPSEVFLYRDFVDFRKAINGLATLVEDELNRDAYTGALFVFCNKAKNKLKILYWDKTGFALWQKRLEKQKFKWPSKINKHEFALTAGNSIGYSQDMTYLVIKNYIISQCSS